MDQIFQYALQALISMFASSMVSRQNYQQAESASALAFARQQEAARENRAYYSYPNQVEQMKEAGLNPHITQPTTVQVMSLGMVLPISTPPNAIAAATGMIEQKDMVKTGLIMGVLGLVIGYGMLIVLGSTGFFG